MWKLVEWLWVKHKWRRTYLLWIVNIHGKSRDGQGVAKASRLHHVRHEDMTTLVRWDNGLLAYRPEGAGTGDCCDWSWNYRALPELTIAIEGAQQGATLVPCAIFPLLSVLSNSMPCP